MNVNLNYLLCLRLVFILMTVLGLFLLYENYNLIHFWPIILIDCASLLICFLKTRAGLIVKLTAKRLAGMVVFIFTMSAVGFMAGYDGGTFFDGVLTLWFYSALSTCLLGLVMPFIFSDRNRAINHTVAEFGTSSAAHLAEDRIATSYFDSDYDLRNNEVYWPQNDYHTTSALYNSPGVNPASGLPMANDAIDVGGNVYGFGEPMFNDDSFHTNQFSDFDYHNNP